MDMITRLTRMYNDVQQKTEEDQIERNQQLVRLETRFTSVETALQIER